MRSATTGNLRLILEHRGRQVWVMRGVHAQCRQALVVPLVFGGRNADAILTHTHHVGRGVWHRERLRHLGIRGRSHLQTHNSTHPPSDNEHTFSPQARIVVIVTGSPRVDTNGGHPFAETSTGNSPADSGSWYSWTK